VTSDKVLLKNISDLEVLIHPQDDSLDEESKELRLESIRRFYSDRRKHSCNLHQHLTLILGEVKMKVRQPITSRIAAIADY
jgi:hypothetical protein